MYNISILMPCYNCENTLEKAVFSVIKQKNWHELIMVDDASTDNTFKLMQSLSKLDNKIQIYSLKQNSGAAIARNIAANYANGEILGFLDADDEHQDNIYTFAGQFLSSLPQLSAVRFGTIFAGFPVELLEIAYQDKLNALLNTFIPNLFVYKSIFNLLGGFPHNEVLRKYGGEDGVFSYLLQELFLVGTNYENKLLIHNWHKNVHAEKFLKVDINNGSSNQALVVQVSNKIIGEKLQQIRSIFTQYNSTPTHNFKGFVPVYIKDN